MAPNFGVVPFDFENPEARIAGLEAMPVSGFEQDAGSPRRLSPFVRRTLAAGRSPIGEGRRQRPVMLDPPDCPPSSSTGR